jgi:hypothetical protein
MLISEIISIYLDNIIEGLKRDADSKGQRIPQGFEKTVSDEGGSISVEHYFRYLVVGRGPGKQPPPDAMLAWVEKHPEIIAEFRATYREIEAKEIAYIIGRKIGREGTDIYQGKKPGIDLAGVVDASMPEFLERLAYAEALEVANKIEKVAA